MTQPENPPLIYVDLIEEKPHTLEDYSRQRVFVTDLKYQKYLDKFQPWRWVARSGDNQRRLARSTERYFNEADCRHAIELLFSSGSNVFLRQAETGNVLLRRAQ